MTSDRDNPLLDACLDEVLGGRTPPDLTARILQAHAARRSVDLSVLPAVLPGPAPDYSAEIPAPPPVVGGVNGQPVVELATIRTSANRQSRRSDWQPLLVAASILGVAVAIGAAAYYATSGPQIAEKPADNAVGPAVVLNSNSQPSKEKTQPRPGAHAGRPHERGADANSNLPRPGPASADRQHQSARPAGWS